MCEVKCNVKIGKMVVILECTHYRYDFQKEQTRLFVQIPNTGADEKINKM